MSEIIRVGVIGSGRIAQRHFRAYGENADRVKVVLVADPDTEAATTSAEIWGVEETCVDYHELLARDDIEAVSICTPTVLHPTIAIDAFAAGKHVLSEKPAGLDADLFREAMAAGAASGKVFTLGFMERQMTNYAALREVIQSGRIGRPVIARTASFGPQLYTNPDFADGAVNGGPFIDMFCHSLDTWCHAFDSKVVSVCASGCSFAEASGEGARLAQPALDTGDATILFESGDRATLTAGWSMPDLSQLKMLRQSIKDTIIGPRGFVHGGVRGTMQVITADGEESIENDGIGEAHRKQIAAFCASIRDGAPVAAPPEAGLHTLQVSLAILRSMKENRVVRIDEI